MESNDLINAGMQRAQQIASDQEFLRDLIQTLGSTEGVLRSALSGMGHEDQLRRPVENEWAIVEVLCHLLDLEREIFPARTAMIRKDDGSMIAAFDQDAWARERKYSSADPYRVLEDFCGARKRNIELVRKIRDDELDCSASHSEFGSLTLRALLADWAASDLLHTAQIQRIRLWRFYPELGPFQRYFKGALRIKE